MLHLLQFLSEIRFRDKIDHSGFSWPEELEHRPIRIHLELRFVPAALLH